MIPVLPQTITIRSPTAGVAVTVCDPVVVLNVEPSLARTAVAMRNYWFDRIGYVVVQSVPSFELPIVNVSPIAREIDAP